jgi:RNA polymerase sigma-70 factor, ECF subfamily
MSRSAPVVEALALPVRVTVVRPDRSTGESELILRSQRGDRDAFEELVRRDAARLNSAVVRFVSDREEASEVTQEAFLRAWRGIGSFRSDSRFFTWIYRIAINEARRRGESRNRREPVASLDGEAAPEPADWSQLPETRFEQKDLRRELDEAIAALPLSHRVPLVLRDIEGLSTAESADIMSIGEAAFKSRLHRARLAVRLHLDRYFAEEGRG